MSSASISSLEVTARNASYTQPHASFKDILGGEDENRAFYNQPNYLADTRRDFAQKKPLPVNYTWDTESKCIRILKQIFSIIIFPIGIYKLLHALVGKVGLLPASSPWFFK